jgi:phytoene dehydrogenase-like protein
VEVVALDSDGRRATLRDADGATLEADAVVCAAAPAVLDRLLDRPPREPAPEGSQLKINMVLTRLPRLRDRTADPADAFAGTLHLHESYAELEAAHATAAAGALPDPLPCEVYCHSLSDPTILGPELREAGAHTLTLFGLHAPAALFRADNDAMRERATAAALRALQAVLAEPLEDCLWRDAAGRPCLEARTPLDLEAELALPAGHIFHRDLAWPWAEDDADAGRWGVETDLPNVVLGGAGARRGGGVSGIAGHNAARALLDGSVAA